MIPLPQILPRIEENRAFYENGISHLIDRLRLKVISNIEDCFLLWEKFSHKKSLFDLWDFRYSWFAGYRYQPYFYSLYEGKTPLAILPLWYDKERRRYEWFGSDWMEDNRFFVTQKELIPLLLKIAPRPLFLNAIEEDKLNYELRIVNYGSLGFSNDDEKYIVDIKRFKAIDDYLFSLNKKHRYNLKKDFERIMAFNPKIEIMESTNFRDFQSIVSLSKNRFNGDDPSDLINPKRLATYKAILKNSGLYKAKFIKVFIQNYLAACDLIVTYNDRYYTLKGANDVFRFSGIGNFLVYLEADDAINNGFSLIDCLQIDYGWKHKYYQVKRLFKFEKGDSLLCHPERRGV